MNAEMRQVRTLGAIVACLWALQAAPVAAQQDPPLPHVSGDRTVVAAPAIDVRTPGLVAAGVLGGAAGWVLGTIAVGIPLSHALPATDDGLSTPGIIIGLQLGQAIGIPTGVHMANGWRGGFRRSLLLSLAAGAVGTALLWTGDFDAAFEDGSHQIILVAVPLVQLIASIHSTR